MEAPHSPKRSRSLLRRAIIILVAIAITVSGAYSIAAGSVSSTTSFLGGGDNYAANVPAGHLTMVGADQVIQGGPETYSFVQSVASQGLRWDRDSVGTNTQKLANLQWAQQAGIHVLALMGGADPETSCTPGFKGSGVLQSESTYKNFVKQLLTDWPWIHNWEYGNEIQYYWCNISPQHYFQGLVWTYEVLSTTPGHQSDTIQGPTETIYTYAPSGVWDGYDGCGTISCVDQWDGTVGDKIGWFYSFWHESITDSQGTWTPSRVLTYVSLHVYTQQELFSDKPKSGPYATVGAMLTAALNVYYSVTGNSKEFVISETGYHTGSGASTSDQTIWYQQMVPFYESEGFVTGVFAYALYDTQPTPWGLFTSSLQARPAWSAYQKLFAGVSTTTTTTTTTTTSSSNPTTTTTSSDSTSSTSSVTSTLTSTTTQISTDTTNSSTTTSYSTSTNTTQSSTLVTSQTNSSLSTSSSSTRLSTVPPSRMPSNHTGIDNNGSGSLVGLLSSLSPSRDPPVADGFAAYEILLIAGFVIVYIGSRKTTRHHWPPKW